MPPLQRPPPPPASQLPSHSRSFCSCRHDLLPAGVCVPLPACLTCCRVDLQGLAGAGPSFGTRVTTSGRSYPADAHRPGHRLRASEHAQP